MGQPAEVLPSILELLDLEYVEENLYRSLRGLQRRVPALRRPGSGAGPVRGRAHRPGRPPAALAARLLPAAGKHGPADPLPGGTGPRRAVVLRAPGGGHPGRRGHLQHGRVVRRGAARRGRGRGSGPRTPGAGPAARLDRSAARVVRVPVGAAGAPGCPPSSGSAARPNSPTTRCCTPPSSPTSPTSPTASSRWREPRCASGPSLDHAVWFHRPVRMDEWIWQDLVPHTAAGGRGLYTGTVYSAGGARVATIAQEALFRKKPARQA